MTAATDRGTKKQRPASNPGAVPAAMAGTHSHSHCEATMDSTERRPTPQDGASDFRFVVLVTGSRHGVPGDAAFIRASLLRFGATEVVHGGARGVDETAGLVARELGLVVRSYPVKPIDGQWPGAGPRRNQRMIDAEPQIDAAIAVPSADSKGTWDCVRRLQRRGVPVDVMASGRPLGASR